MSAKPGPEQAEDKPWCTCVSQQGFVYSPDWETYVHSACGDPSKPIYDAVTARSHHQQKVRSP